MTTPSNRKKLLLIDDEPEAHESLRKVMGFPPPLRPPLDLLKALTFEEGVRIIVDEHPDFCLLDLKLSETMKGMDTIRAAQETGIVDMLPVLIITGQVEFDDNWGHGTLWCEAREAGACGYLIKDRYLDPQFRKFLLHELSDAFLEFDVRRKRGIRFGGRPHGPTA